MFDNSTADVLDVPEIQPFQFDLGSNGSLSQSVNQFRGDVNLNLPLVSLTGRNGLDLSLAAAYSSAVETGATVWNRQAPTGILGLGWSLPSDFISVEYRGSGANEGNAYTLVRAGAQSPLCRTTRRWQRGALATDLVSNLNAGVLDTPLREAFATQGLALSTAATLTVVSPDTQWTVTDPTGEFTLDIEAQSGTLTVWDGGLAYESLDFDFSRIAYYPAFERWVVISPGGIAATFGGGLAPAQNGVRTSAGNGIQWTVFWDNWTGPSTLTHDTNSPPQRLQSQLPCVWNQTASTTVWGDTVQFAYEQVLQSVGADGLPYTKACYLSQATDVFGRTVRLFYGEKTFTLGGVCEYHDPHKSVPDNTPNAYQDRYETRYLDHLQVSAADSFLLYTLNFSYDLRSVAPSVPNQPPTLAGETTKRFLTTVTKTLPDGSVLPSTTLAYYSTADTNPGALHSLVAAEGGVTTYTYTAKELTNCSRSLTIQAPLQGGTPRVWFGSDYTVVVWYVSGKIDVRLYTWIGRWQAWRPQGSPYSDNVVLDDLTVETQENFCVLHYANANGNSAIVRAYHRDPRILGNWTLLDLVPAITGDTQREIASGDRFFTVNDIRHNAVTRYTWSDLTQQWNKDTPAMGCASGTPGAFRLFTTGIGNVFLSLCYDKTGAPNAKRSKLRLDWVNELGTWTTGTPTAAPEIVIEPGTNFDTNFQWTPMASVIAASFITKDAGTNFAYRVALYSWGGVSTPYQLRTAQWFDFNETRSQPSNQTYIPWVASGEASGLIVTGPNLLRYTGQTWVVNHSLAPTTQPTDGTLFWITSAGDVAVTTQNAPTVTIGMAQAFDPNAMAWANPAYTLATLTPPNSNARLSRYFPSATPDYATWDTNLYARNTSTNWATPFKSPTVPFPLDMDSTTLLNVAPDYFAYLNVTSDGSGVTGATVLPLVNGVLQTPEALPQRFFQVVKPDGTFDFDVDGKAPGGAGSFVTYLPLTSPFDQATSLTLYRFLDGSISAPISDAPVYTATLDDGYSRQSYTYNFDVTSAVCDPSGTVAKYYRSSVVDGQGGQVDYVFQNGVQNTNGGNPTELAALDGLLLSKSTLNTAGQLVAQTSSEWTVQTQVATAPGGPLVALWGGYIQALSSTAVQDGVTTQRTYSYDAASGQVLEQGTTAHNALGQQESYGAANQYGHQVYSALWYANRLRELVQTKSTVAVAGATAQTTSLSASTWAPYSTLAGNSGMGAAIYALAKSYRWRGGAPDADFNFAAWSGATEPPADQWLKVAQINRRTARGLVCEREAPIGTVQTSLYDAAESMNVATFTNALTSVPEAFYYGFEAYEDAQGWDLDGSATPLTDTFSSTGERCLRLPAGATGAALTRRFSANTEDRLFAFWAKTGSDFIGGASAGWIMQFIDANGAALGASVTVPIVASDDWQYYAQVVSPTTQSGAAGVVLTPFNHSGADVYLDDVSFADFVGQFTANVYTGPSLLTTAQVGPYDVLARQVRDSQGRKIAQTDSAQNIIRVTVPYLSRQSNAAFDPAEPNRVVYAQPMGETFYERFRNGGDWEASWSSTTPQAWTSAQGVLTGTGTTPDGALTPSRPTLTSSFAFCLTVQNASAITQAVGLRAGALSVTWTPQTGWTLVDSAANTTQSCVFASATPGRLWTFLVFNGVVFFLVDGRQAFCYTLPTPLTGAPGIYAAGAASFSDVVIGNTPQVAASFFDGATKKRQGHSLEEAGSVVTALVYDAAGRGAVRTRAAQITPTASAPLLTYRPAFVTSMDWTTGLLTGEASDAYPSDNGFCYTRHRFEDAPSGRLVEIGLPGADFAIGNLTTTDGAARHTRKFAYTASDSTGVAGALQLPTGCYTVTTITDPDGNLSQSVTNETGFRVAEGVASDITGTSFLLASRTAAYTTAGQTLTHRLPNFFAPPDPAHQAAWVRVTQFDALGRRTAFQDPNAAATQYVYDNAGQLRFMQDGMGAQNGYFLYRKYAGVGRLVEEGSVSGTWNPATLSQIAQTQPDWPGTADGATPSCVYQYDGDRTAVSEMGLLTALEHPEPTNGQTPKSRLSYEYDACSRVAASAYNNGTAQTVRTTYVYDNLGNLTQKGYPSGRQVFYRRDAVGRLVSIADASGTIAAYTYSAEDRIVSETQRPGTPAQIATGYTYNSPGWLQSIATPLWSENLQYTEGGYNNAAYYSGKIAAQRTTFHGTLDKGFPTDVAFAYAYDSTGRLATASVAVDGTPQPNLSIGLPAPICYDANGNLLAVPMGSATENYAYAPGSDFLVSTSAADGTFTANADGAVKSAAPRGITDMAYDPSLVLPVQIATQEQGTVALEYDPRGRRMVKTTTTGSRTYAYDALGTLVQEQEANGATTEYVYGPTGLLEIQSGTDALRVLRDHLRSTRALVDDSLQLVAAFQYQPYGSPMGKPHGDAAATRYLFMGYEWDAETGLYATRARLYDPQSRRFFALDPEMQFASPYVFAGNDPVSQVDPDGASSWWANLIGAVVATILSVAIAVLTDGAGAALVGLAVNADAAASATGTAVAGAIDATVGFANNAVTGVIGDAVTAGIDHEPFTATRALTDVLTAGAYTGGSLAGVAAAERTIARGLGSLPATLTQNAVVKEAVVQATGGLVGGIASTATGSVVSGSPFFTVVNATDILMGGVNGAFSGAFTKAYGRTTWGSRSSQPTNEIELDLITDFSGGDGPRFRPGGNDGGHGASVPVSSPMEVEQIAVNGSGRQATLSNARGVSAHPARISSEELVERPTGSEGISPVSPRKPPLKQRACYGTFSSMRGALGRDAASGVGILSDSQIDHTTRLLA